jgi:mRNA interferase MazF
MVASMTTKGRDYPTRVSCAFQGKKTQIVLDQIRTVDKKRLIKRLVKNNSRAQIGVFSVLAELFSE